MTSRPVVDAPNPIGPTSRWMAAARARETERPDALIHDPLAAALAGAEGFTWLDDMQSAAGSDGPGIYPVIRTRFFDDVLLDACRRSRIRQVVLVAAGLDTRAFRLAWPARTQLYELDLPEVLSAKQDVLDDAGATPGCERHAIGVDLGDPGWTQPLTSEGYRPEQRSVWIIEGLLFYLARPAVHELLATVSPLMARDSVLGLDIMNRGLFFSPAAWPMQTALAQRGAPGRFGTNTPERLLHAHGFEARVTQPGQAGANFGRWPSPLPVRELPAVPRSFLITAQRS